MRCWEDAISPAGLLAAREAEEYRQNMRELQRSVAAVRAELAEADVSKRKRSKTRRWTPERLKRLRKKTGLSQQAFGDSITRANGVAVSKWETGARCVPFRLEDELDDLEASFR